jgi:uncharacterized protein YkwD
MIRTARRLLPLLIASVLATMVTTLAPAAPAHAVVVNGVSLNASEAGLVRYINAARKKAGIAPVKVTPGTTDVARRWARYMAAKKVLKHNPNFASQLRKAGSTRWTRVTENVGYASACNIKQLFDAYMKSPGHRKNILDRNVRVIGIGSVDTTARAWPCGVLYNTMNFANHYNTSYGKSRVAADKLTNY